MAALYENRQRLISTLTERTRLILLAERIAGLGHWHLDLDDGRLDWSEELFRIHGFPPGRAPDLITALNTFPPDDRAKIKGGLDAAIRTGSDFRTQVRIVRPDGCIRHVLVKGETILKDGTPQALFGVVQDITRQVENEALLEAAVLAPGKPLRRRPSWPKPTR